MGFLANRAMALAALAGLAAGSAATAATPSAADLSGRLGAENGVWALLGDKGAQLALDLAKGTTRTLFVQLATQEDFLAAAKAADAAGLLGTRVFVARGTPARIGLADNVADAVVVLDAAAGTRAEALRVLRPEGKALVGDEIVSKPFPQGVDDWSHHFHGPDNNPQSLDTVARAPFLTQFVAAPRYAPAPQQVVASAGRLFMAFGHIAWHQREEDVLDTLMAVNAYNGTVLWKKPLPSGFMVDRSTMIATPTALYVADDKSCKLLDPATGEVKDEIAVPADLSDGTFWKWMAMEGGVLYALVGKPEPPDPVAKWRSTRHGWPWGGISKGYNDRDLPWGFARTVLAIDPKTKKVLWHRQQDPPIDARATCLKGSRLYIGHYGQFLACLDAKTGKDIWRRTAEKDPDLFKAIGPYRPGQGYVQGWRTQAYLKCTDQALYFVGPQVPWLSAVSAADGRFLWKHNAMDLHIVIRGDGLYVIAAQNKPKDTKKLNPLTGQVVAEYDTRRRACTRATGSADGIFFRAHEGSGRLDFASGKTQWISPMRPSCHVGVIVANGLCTWIPWTCDCNLQMFGLIALGPAGDFAFGQKASAQERLEKFAPDAELKGLDVAAADWPAYRGNNARTATTKAAAPDSADILWMTSRPALPTAPVVAGGLAFVGDATGVVRALNLVAEKVEWTAYTGGAIAFPPAIAGGRAFVGSADGYVHAFEAATGKPLWRFRAAPVERRIPVYGALRSTWPVASSLLADGGTVYAAAGMTDFDGTHLYALDAATGQLKWQNNTSGHLDPFSRRGVACQGELLLHQGTLYLASGNYVSPAAFDAATGECRTAPPPTMGTTAVRGRELQLAGNAVKVSGQPLYSKPGYVVFDGSCQWQPMVVAAANARVSLVARKGEAGEFWAIVATKPDGSELWAHPLPSEPVRWGIALDARSRIVVTLRTGQLLCLGKKQ
ncbi:MAG TPA: PQQ-binding-like beta-propeller repeat protein [Planctomycetota bacterium]|nr:PQQ-binding-like beta-propeller repeat protein [Planctomycetota bacterium]